MEAGDRIEIDITSLAYGGDGVGRHEGLVIFVPFVIPGERVRVELTQQKPRYWHARLIEVLTPSPDRVAPRCAHFGACGGCHYQHIRYERQVPEKKKQTEELLVRIGKMAAVPAIAVVPCPLPFAYRNRIRVHRIPEATGFYAAGEPRVIDIAECLLADEDVNAGLKEFRARTHQPGDYDIRSVFIEEGGFQQVNPYMHAQLMFTVRDAVPQTGTHLFEGYCGGGFLTRAVHERFARVTAVDWDKRAISRAAFACPPNVTLLLGDVKTAFRKAEGPFDVVLLDPPRDGLPDEVTDRLLTGTAETLVYVSCDPATFARDVARLAPGWTLEALWLLDMFPQTVQAELVSRFVRKPAAGGGSADRG
ncbi:MAG: class I SAM-dependent RNA methyltransferase [Kiritimatiellae bacterium]|nr:class I SAM-dependent RNA methyltransferase [Kiritimatiellia bacterium]